MKLTKELFKTSLNYERYKKMIIISSVVFVILSLIFLLLAFEIKDSIGPFISFIIVTGIFCGCIILHYVTKIRSYYKNLDTFEFYNVTLTKFQHSGSKDTFYSEIELYHGLTVETDIFWTGEMLSLTARNVEDYINKEVTIVYSKDIKKVVVFDGILE